MSDLPKRLLKDVVWMLRPILYGDRDEFEAAVRRYHVDILGDDERWRPAQRVLAARKIHLCFECWEGDAEVDVKLELATEDPDGWTTLDLMYAVHQRVADYLSTHDATMGDHCFFEGLSLRSAKGDPPTYDLDAGS